MTRKLDTSMHCQQVTSLKVVILLIKFVVQHKKWFYSINLLNSCNKAQIISRLPPSKIFGSSRLRCSWPSGPTKGLELKKKCSRDKNKCWILYTNTVILTCFTLLAFLRVSCKMEGRLTILLEGMTVELDVRPSSTLKRCKGLVGL